MYESETSLWMHRAPESKREPPVVDRDDLISENSDKKDETELDDKKVQ